MHEWIFTTVVLLAASLCGAGVLTPFLSQLRFVMLAAPMAGLFVVPWSANAIYALLNLDYKTSALLSAAAWLSLTAITCRSIARSPAIYWLALALPIMAAITVGLMDSASLRAGGPAVLFQDGSDHAGYAQLADWLNSHSVRQMPRASPDHPYESWPEVMFSRDPRFGSFGLLAIVAELHHTSGIFAFDVCCALVLAAACLGVAASYAASWKMLILLAGGLLLSQWFDDAHMGFFGKLISYPAALLLCGLVLACLQSPSASQTFAIAILAAAVGTMHSGAATSLLITPILLLALAVTAAGSDSNFMKPALLLCGLAILMPAVSSGIFARVSSVIYPDFHKHWRFVLPHALDIESHGSISALIPPLLATFALAAAIVWIAALGLSLRWRSPRAVGLLGGPMLLLASLLLLHARAAGFQLVGWLYPATFCGLCALLSCAPSRGRDGVLLLLVICIGLRLPRFVGAVDRYALDLDPNFVFTQSEMNDIARHVGSAAVLIDVDQPFPAIFFLLAETGRRHMDVQWSPPSWHIIVNYRPWPWTPPPVRSRWVIRMSAQQTLHHHFDLTINP